MLYWEQGFLYDKSSSSPIGWYMSNAKTRQLSHPLPVLSAREIDDRLASVSPRAHLTDGSPLITSGTTSPMNPQSDGSGLLSSWFPSSQCSSVASSPPSKRPLPGHSPGIDGNELVHQARSRFSCEQFGAFLFNTYELNAKRQSREETLRKAEEIFGSDNKDLHLSFQRKIILALIIS